MKIGISYDLKADLPTGDNLPDDFQEEFDSPVTIEAIAAVLRSLGHEVQLLGDGRELLERLLQDPPDFVFNIAEGQGIGRSREARVPAVLEMLGIPHTGSDPLTLAATLDKDVAKRLLHGSGIAVPRGFVFHPDCMTVSTPLDRPDGQLNFPVIVKPAWEGSSKGIRIRSVVERPDDVAGVVESIWRDHRQPVLVEEYIAGDELTVGLVGNLPHSDTRPLRMIGIMRVLPTQPSDRFVYSLEVKRDYQRQVRYECPPRLPPRILSAVEAAAFRAYEVLGCRDVARIDFRLRDGVPYFLEVNPLPGLNPESSDLVILARLAGWSYEQLIESILRAALLRTTHRGSLRP
jgi:D-alanine-D-alanine ligase